MTTPPCFALAASAVETVSAFLAERIPASELNKIALDMQAAHAEMIPHQRDWLYLPVRDLLHAAMRYYVAELHNHNTLPQWRARLHADCDLVCAESKRMGHPIEIINGHLVAPVVNVVPVPKSIVSLPLADAAIDLKARVFGVGVTQEPRGFVAISADMLHVYIHESRRGWLASGQPIVEEYAGFAVRWRFNVGPVVAGLDRPVGRGGISG